MLRLFDVTCLLCFSLTNICATNINNIFSQIYTISITNFLKTDNRLFYKGLREG